MSTIAVLTVGLCAVFTLIVPTDLGLWWMIAYLMPLVLLVIGSAMLFFMHLEPIEERQ